MEVTEYIKTLRGVLEELPLDRIQSLVELLLKAREEGRKVFLCGNGGSAATASHLVADLQKCLIGQDYRTLQAIALTDSIPLITAWANDTDYSRIFAEQVRALASPGDIVIAFSGSGNSPNVLAAVRAAKEIGAYTVGLTGYDGGQLAGMVDLSIHVPIPNMQIAEDTHLVIGHIVFTQLRDKIASMQ